MASPKAEPASSTNRFKYTAIPGFFRQDDVSTDPQTFDYDHSDFGLIDRYYPVDATFDYSTRDSQCERFAHYISTLNNESPDPVQYKVIFMGRHGQGVHNVVEDLYGSPVWCAHWSNLDGNGTVTWVDAHLTDLGTRQAQAACKFPLDRCLATAKHTFSRLPLPLERPFKPMVKEMLRERIGAHTCDRRSTLTYIRCNYPDYDVEEGFTEDDERYSSERRETDEEMDTRLRCFLDDVFDHDRKTFVSFTSHSGAIASLLRVLGHIPFRLATGSVIPVAVRADKLGHGKQCE